MKKQLSKIVINDKRGKNSGKEHPLKRVETIEQLKKVSFEDSPEGEPWTQEKIAEVYPDLPVVRGHFVLLRIFEDNHDYLRDEKGNVTCIVKPEDFNQRSKYLHVVGLVVAMGEECYDRNPSPWAYLGEWHVVDRYAGYQYTYDGIPFLKVMDEKVNNPVKNPEKVGRL